MKGQLHKFRNNETSNLFNQTNFPELGRRGKKDLSQQVNFELVNISRGKRRWRNSKRLVINILKQLTVNC